MHGYSKEKILLNQDYKDILRVFSDEEVEYLLVGAYALASHGYPRATGDIDLWVKASKENAAKVLSALKKFGAPLSQILQADFEIPGVVFQIGVEPRRIDILTQISGVDNFDSAWERRINVGIDGIDVPVIGREDLKQNKKASGRPKDLADLAWLESDE